MLFESKKASLEVVKTLVLKAEVNNTPVDTVVGSLGFILSSSKSLQADINIKPIKYLAP